jgi:hypothetical protein
MATLETTKDTLADWANVTTDQINNLQMEICTILAMGRPGINCDKEVLGDLIDSLKENFPQKKLGALRASDLKSPGKIRTVVSLSDFIDKSADQPLG